MSEIKYDFRDVYGSARYLAETGTELSDAAQRVREVSLSALHAGSPVAAEAVGRFVDDWCRRAAAGALSGSAYGTGTHRAAQGLGEAADIATRVQRRYSADLTGDDAVRNLGA